MQVRIHTILNFNHLICDIPCYNYTYERVTTKSVFQSRFVYRVYVATSRYTNTYDFLVTMFSFSSTVQCEFLVFINSSTDLMRRNLRRNLEQTISDKSCYNIFVGEYYYLFVKCITSNNANNFHLHLFK